MLAGLVVTNANIITRAVGVGPELQIDTKRGDVKAGDLFLLASDGLTRLVDDKELLAELTSNRPAEAVDNLVEKVLSRKLELRAALIGVDAGHMVTRVQRMAHQHRVALVGVERAVGLVGERVVAQLRAAAQQQRLLEPEELRRNLADRSGNKQDDTPKTKHPAPLRKRTPGGRPAR